MLMPRILLSVIVSLTASSIVAAGNEDTLELRLAELEKRLEAARIETHVPGMSIVIVQGDKVIWTKGFGLANLETGMLADEETIYGIGSTTKAFTSLLIGTLVDEGRVNWDDPVNKLLPYFDLKVRSADEQATCTLRDLLSHRHGFSRMGILYIGGNRSREAILRTAAQAEPIDNFREGFHYSNLAYLAAGQAAGEVAGSSYEELVEQRIFVPLQMSSSSLSLADAQQDEHLAQGYKWDESIAELTPATMIDLGVIAAAGSINSNVTDMANWVRMLLGEGEFEDQRLVSSARLLETFEPQIAMGDGASYGLGWMLRELDGRKIIEHGGNTDGYSAQVALCLEEDLGYVLLMNQTAAPLRAQSLEMVFGALLDDMDERADEPAGSQPVTEADFDEYTGVYIANFARFRDDEFEIFINAGQLALNMGGKQQTDLKLPDQSGRWFSTQTDSIAISFQRDAGGSIRGLTMHNGDYHFELPRQGVELPPNLDTRELEKYTGKYVLSAGSKRVEVLIVHGQLALEDKGNLLTFSSPGSDGHAPLRARPEQGATFSLDADGIAESFIFHGNAGDRLFKRLVDTTDTQLPSLEELLALRQSDEQSDALEGIGGTKITGEAWAVQAGLRGALTIYSQGHDRYANHMDFGDFGRVSSLIKGDQAWSFYGLRGLRELRGDERTQVMLDHPDTVTGNWSRYFDSIEVVGTDTVNGRAVYVVRLKNGRARSRTYRIDVENGDVLRTNQLMVGGPMPIPLETNYFDFEEHDGIRQAMRVEIENPASGKMVWTFAKIETGLQLGDEFFSLAAPVMKSATSD
ncbi:MAG: CubicO group peptidase (beta-lactamase class C family) [Planctomycetota bacterium]|jgi:CubicO group peptidase (beta-lactamase class C family)